MIHTSIYKVRKFHLGFKMRDAHELTGHFTTLKIEKMVDFGSKVFVLFHFIQRTDSGE